MGEVWASWNFTQLLLESASVASAGRGRKAKTRGRRERSAPTVAARSLILRRRRPDPVGSWRRLGHNPHPLEQVACNSSTSSPGPRRGKGHHPIALAPFDRFICTASGPPAPSADKQRQSCNWPLHQRPSKPITLRESQPTPRGRHPMKRSEQMDALSPPPPRQHRIACSRKLARDGPSRLGAERSVPPVGSVGNNEPDRCPPATSAAVCHRRSPLRKLVDGVGHTPSGRLSCKHMFARGPPSCTMRQRRRQQRRRLRCDVHRHVVAHDVAPVSFFLLPPAAAAPLRQLLICTSAGPVWAWPSQWPDTCSVARSPDCADGLRAAPAARFGRVFKLRARAWPLARPQAVEAAAAAKAGEAAPAKAASAQTHSGPESELRSGRPQQQQRQLQRHRQKQQQLQLQQQQQQQQHQQQLQPQMNELENFYHHIYIFVTHDSVPLIQCNN